MKNFNLTQMLQGCSRRNEMAVSASNSGGGQTCQVKQQTRLMSEDEKWSEKEALSSTCLRNASVIPPFCFRYVAMIFAVLTLSIANIGMAWADDPDRGFWSDDGAYVRFYRNNTYEYSCTVDGTGQGDYDLGNIDSDGGLYWTDLWAKTWYKDMFESVTFYWRVKGRDAGEGPDYSNYGLGWRHDFESGGKWHGYWDQASKSETCSTTGLAAGNYEVEFFWAAYGKDKKTYYLSNGGSNYHANFTLRRKITYNTDGSTAGTAPSTEWWDGAATVRDNTGLLRRSDGKVFAGWADSKARADAGNIDHEPGQSNMSVTLTADLDLYPVWRDGYYLITPGATSFNLYPTAPFLTTSTATGTSITVNGVNFSSKCWQAGSGAKVVDVTYAEGNHIVYDTQTDNEDIFVYVKGTGNLHYVIFKEGVAYTADASDTVTIGSEKVFKFSIVHSKKSRLVIGFNGTTPKVANIKVVKHGSALAAPCTPGYQLSFPGRAGTAKNGTIDGITLVGNSNLTFGKGNVFQPKTQNSHYAQFTTTATAVQLQVTTTDNDNFYVCTDKSSPTTTGVTLGGSDATHSANLQPSTTYYIVPNGNQVEITKIAFASCASFTATRGGQSSGSYTVGGYDGSALTCTPSVKGFYTYQWKQNTSNSKVGAVNAVGTGANTASFTPNPASAGTYYYYCVATNGCSSAQETTLSGAFTFSEACSAPTSPSISGTMAYSAGGNIELTASATGTDGETTYQWYKGDPENGGVSQGDASTSGATFTKASCVVGDAGTYYCVISNGEGCTVTTYQAITVSCLTAPSAVTSLTNSAHTATSLTYTWTKASNASSYTATLYSDADCVVSVEAKALGDVATATFTGLTPNATYYCKVQSKGNGTVYCEDGGTTSKVSGTTDAPSTPTFSPTSGTTVSGSQTITITGHSGSTVYYAWATSAQSASDIYNSGSGSHGTADAGTASTPVQSGKTLYAISRLSGVNSSVSSASYTVDATAPTLSSSVPANSATGVNTSGTIVLTFSEALSSVDGSKFTLTNATKGAVAIDGSDNTKVNIAYSGASYSTTVTLATAAGAVADAVGNTSAALSSISFTTKAEPTLTALEEGTLYTAQDMASNECGTLSETSCYSSGVSSNTMFKVIGDASKTEQTGGTPESKTCDKVTLNENDFTTVMWLKGQATLSSKIPEDRALKFMLPKAGSLTIYYRDNNDSKAAVNLAKSGSDPCWESGSKGNHYEIKTGLSDGTYYIYADKGSTAIYGLYYDKAPEFVSSTPANGATDVAVSGTIVLTFDESIESVTAAKYSLSEGTISAVAIDGTDATKVNITYSGLPGATDITLSVAAGAVTDAAGNTSAALSDITFTTVATGYAITNGNPSHGSIAITDEDENDITSAEEDATVTITASPSDGYSFSSWTVTKDAGGDVDVTSSTTSPTTFSMPGEDVTVSATFSEITHMVSVAAGAHGTVSPSSVSGVGIATASGNITATPATGYSFNGWTLPSGVTAAAGKTASSNPISINATSDDLTITATWTTVSYTITYILNSGSLDGSQKTSYNIETEDYDLPTPTRDDYVFQGWYTDEDFTSDRVYTLAEGSTGNKTYYAKWADDLTINWTITKVSSKLYKGGTGYTVTAEIDDASWDASGDKDDLVLSASDGVTLGTPTKSINGDGKAQVSANFSVAGDVEGDKIYFTLSVPAADDYSAIDDEKEVELDDCPAGSGSAYVIPVQSSASDPDGTGGMSYAWISDNGYITRGFGASSTGVYEEEYTGISSYRSNSGAPGWMFKTVHGGSTIRIYLKGTQNDGTTISSVYYKTSYFSETSSATSLTPTSTAYYTSAGVSCDNIANGVAGYAELSFSSALADNSFVYFTTNKNTHTYGVSVVGSGGSGGIETSLAWSDDDAIAGTVNKDDDDDDFQIYASPTPANAGGTITYNSSNTSVATVSSDGTVHIVNDGSTTITASMPAYGCYSAATSITYSLVVANTCPDEPGTIVDYDGNAIAGNKVSRGACETLTLKLTGYSEGASIKWYKDGDEIAGATNATYAVPTGQSGVYSAKSTLTGDSHCSLSSTNSITVTTAGSIDPTIFAKEFTVKSGRPFHYRLMQLNKGESVSVKSATSWTENTDFVITKDADNIVYISSKTYAGVTIASAGTETITLTISNECGGDPTDKAITIHKITATAKPTVAWIATSTDNTKGVKDCRADQSTSTTLYKYLETNYTMTARNCYWETREDSLVKEYSKYDLVILTDYPNSGTCPSGKSGKSNSYTNAIGQLIDYRPIMTFEAFVAGCPNWGIPTDPSNTKATQKSLTLLCNAEDIFDDESGKFAAGEDIAITDASSGQALQGFPVVSLPDFVFIGKITDSDTKEYIACCERQVNTSARTLIFGLNSALMSNLTNDGKLMVQKFADYLLETDPASIPDCSVIFNGDGDNASWYNTDNWEAELLPDQYASVRIDAPCVVPENADPAKAGRIKIHQGGAFTGSLTIQPRGRMIVEKTITRIEGDEYTVHKPTATSDVVIETDEDNQGALIFNNESARTQATVKLYSKGCNDGSYKYQYFASPFTEISSSEFEDAYIYTHAESVVPEWTQLRYGEDVSAFQGLSLTADGDAATYEVEGELAPTYKHTYNLTYTSGKSNNKKGTNVVGNSWTAPIQITRIDDSDFDKPSNFEGTVYIYNAGRDAEQGVGQSTNADTSTPGVWQAIPIGTAKTGAWTGSRQIPAYQAFQLKVSAPVKFTIDYNKHVRQSATQGDDNLNEPLHAPRRGTVRAEEVEVLRLCVEDNTANYRAYIFLCEGDEFTENRDHGWEAQQSAGDGKAGKLYAIDPRNDYMMSIARESLEGTPVGFLCGQATEYTITFNETMGYYYLNDMETQQSTLIQEGESYSFTTTKGNHPNRFIISAIPFDKPGIATGVTDLDAEAPKVQKVIYNDKLFIIRGGKVFSADGQLVK